VPVKWFFFHACLGLLGNHSASPEIPLRDQKIQALPKDRCFLLRYSGNLFWDLQHCTCDRLPEAVSLSRKEFTNTALHEDRRPPNGVSSG
jgi:hypothetical protein